MTTLTSEFFSFDHLFITVHLARGLEVHPVSQNNRVAPTTNRVATPPATADAVTMIASVYPWAHGPWQVAFEQTFL